MYRIHDRDMDVNQEDKYKNEVMRDMRQKRLLLLLMAALLVCACAGTAMAAALEIGTAEELAAFRDRVNSGDVSLDARLTQDITLSGNWTPIGQYVENENHGESHYYAGTFDGGGHTVGGLVVTSADTGVGNIGGDITKTAGFFGTIGSDGVVKNVNLADPMVDAWGGPDDSLSWVGGLVGILFGRVENCTVTGGTMTGRGVGGVAGWNYGGAVANCSASGIERIYASKEAGGVVGYNSWDGTTTDCIASGIKSIDSDYSAGGLIGYNLYAKVAPVANNTVSGIGSIYGDSYAGGVIGYNSGESDVINCVAVDIALLSAGDGNGRNDSGAGGVLGYNSGSAVTNCALIAGASSTVISSDASEGGAVGWMDSGAVANFQNCVYPSNVTFAQSEGKPYGNIPLASMDEQYKVTSYDVDETDPAKLPAIVALLEQGVALAVKQGEDASLDVTALPGTQGFENLNFNWKTDDASGDVVSVVPAGASATLSGVAAGTANVTCEVRGDISADLTCLVTVTGTPPDGTKHSGDSSNCSAFGFGLLTLAALPFVLKRKK